MTQTKKKLFTTISNIRILFTMLSDESRKIFLNALNKNPIRYVIESEVFTLDNIQNTDSWEEYFIFDDESENNKLYFINKDQIFEVLNNIKNSIINDTLTHKKFKLN